MARNVLVAPCLRDKVLLPPGSNVVLTADRAHGAGARITKFFWRRAGNRFTHFGETSRVSVSENGATHF